MNSHADSFADSSVTNGGARYASRRKEDLDVVVGFDLGTSSSKVVIRTPFELGGRAVAVPFAGLAPEECPYLLPTRLIQRDSGAYEIPPFTHGDAAPDLKLRLMRRANDNDHQDAALQRMVEPTAYLATALRHAASWFENSEAGRIAGRELRWHVNVGIPSASYDDPNCAETFRLAAAGAWQLVTSKAAISDANLREALYESRQDPDLSRVAVVPEVAAEVVGYARSPLRDPGLHVLVDVGASTLDVCGFLLHEDGGEDLYALLSASVDDFGSYSLHLHRLALLRSAGVQPRFDETIFRGPLGRIPEHCAEYMEGAGGVDPEEVDERFLQSCVSQVMGVLMYLRVYGAPADPHWDTGLPVFLCGGGSLMEIYRRMASICNERLIQAVPVPGLDVRSLPQPRELAPSGLAENLYHRLAVAYGLSFDRDSIGQIEPPHQIPPVPERPRRTWRANYIGAEQV